MSIKITIVTQRLVAEMIRQEFHKVGSATEKLNPDYRAYKLLNQF